jgi:beta-phosphoglucomutase
MRPSAVIFDFDGVIADTMHDNCVAWQDAFKPYGFALKAQEYYQLEGMGRYQIAEHFIEKYHLDQKILNDVVEAKELNYKNNNTFRLYPGVKEILALLWNKNVPVAIVTGASRARIGEHLEEAIMKKLSALVTADDVKNTKPHPEPYLKAVEKIGKQASGCIVVENAILGIQSAKAAGCLCYALETTLSKDSLSLADKIFATHADLFQEFASVFDRNN